MGQLGWLFFPKKEKEDDPYLVVSPDPAPGTLWEYRTVYTHGATDWVWPGVSSDGLRTEFNTYRSGNGTRTNIRLVNNFGTVANDGYIDPQGNRTAFVRYEVRFP